MKKLFGLLASVLMLLSLTTCGGRLPPNVSPTISYERNLVVSVYLNNEDGEPFNCPGVCVLPPAKKYIFVFETPEDMDYFFFDTQAVGRRFEKVGDEFKFIYTPDLVAESLYIPIEVAGLNQDSKHSFANMVIPDPNDTLPVDSHCNMDIKKTSGTTVCQNKAGKTIVLQFVDDVVFSDIKNDENPACAGVLTGQGAKFTFAMPRGVCHYKFMTVKPVRQTLRLETVGWDKAVRMKE